MGVTWDRLQLNVQIMNKRANMALYRLSDYQVNWPFDCTKRSAKLWPLVGKQVFKTIRPSDQVLTPHDPYSNLTKI